MSVCVAPRGSPSVCPSKVAVHFLKCSCNGQSNIYASLSTDQTKNEMVRFELMSEYYRLPHCVLFKKHTQMSSFIMRPFRRCPISPHSSLISVLFGCHSGLRLIPSQPTSPIQSPQESITQRCYLQVTESPCYPSICLSFYIPLPSSPPFLPPFPLVSFTVLPTLVFNPVLSFWRTSQTNQVWGEPDFAYRSYPPLTRDREEKCLHRLHMKPFSNVMDELHFASANF